MFCSFWGPGVEPLFVHVSVELVSVVCQMWIFAVGGEDLLMKF